MDEFLAACKMSVSVRVDVFACFISVTVADRKSGLHIFASAAVLADLRPTVCFSNDFNWLNEHMLFTGPQASIRCLVMRFEWKVFSFWEIREKTKLLVIYFKK